MSLEYCPAAAQECKATMISVAAVSRWFYRISSIGRRIASSRDGCYICTNAYKRKKKCEKWLAEESSNAQNGSGKKFERKSDCGS